MSSKCLILYFWIYLQNRFTLPGLLILFSFSLAYGQNGKLILDSSHQELDTIVLVEKVFQKGDLVMTQNQYKIMPASFQDPSRILIKFPGFSTPNDGANAIVFRGMPPDVTRWQLFGADIVNPNHLSNAGTANDQATGNAGGVNAFSGSVLDYYQFEANPADVSFFNLMSGTSNMKMAPKINSFADFNLIGLESGVNRSFGNKNIYAAYRYSFVGLLDKLGVNFGNEKIGYDDLSIYADVLKSNRQSLKVFGILGSSRNVFNAVPLGSAISRFKDIEDITYKSKLWITGGQYTYEKNKTLIQSTLIYSTRTDSRVEVTDPVYKDSFALNFNQNSLIKEELLSNHTWFETSGKNYKMTYGFRFNMRAKNINNIGQDEKNLVFEYYPYIKWQSDLSTRFKYSVGIGSFYDTNAEEFTIEPNLVLKYRFSTCFETDLDYRFSSIRDFTNIELSTQPFFPPRMKADNVQWSGRYLNNNFQFRTSAFYHAIRDVLNFVSLDDAKGGHYNVFNGGNLGYDQIRNSVLFLPNGTSKARIFGVDIFMENKMKLLGHLFYYNVNGSLFNSKYSLPESVNTFFNAKFNYGFTASAFISYEMNLSDQYKNRKLIISISNHLRGGQREQSLLENNAVAPSFLYDPVSSYSGRLGHYQRLDFRMVYVIGKVQNKIKHRWSLDIQNLLSRENDGFRYFDLLLNSVFLQKQLGLIPVLSYRIEW